MCYQECNSLASKYLTSKKQENLQVIVIASKKEDRARMKRRAFKGDTTPKWSLISEYQSGNSSACVGGAET